MTAVLPLAAVVGLPFVMAAGALWAGPASAPRALRLSVAAALLSVLAVSLAPVDVEIPLLAGRALMLKFVSQLGIQLLGLALLGFVMSLAAEPRESVATWLPVAWLSAGGLTLALLLTALPLALLVFVGAALIWSFGLPPGARQPASGSVMRYVALLALVMPVLLIAYRLAELRTGAAPSIEHLVLALSVPAFGLVLGLVPLHAWSLTLASGTPRPMLIGVVLVVQTAGFSLLLRTLATYPWMTGVASDALVVGGALSACAGGWLALASRPDDPDDWFVYATVASGGMLLAGLGTRSAAAGAGVAMLLFARVLALVILALSTRIGGGLRRLAAAAGTLALAGTPGLVGFPGLWLILRRLEATGHAAATFALLAGSGLLFATAVRRWYADAAARSDTPAPFADPSAERGPRRAVYTLILLLIVLGFAPHVIATAFAAAMRDLFFAHP